MKRWLNWIALVALFSVACGFLANWQFDRRATKLAAIELIQHNYKLDPVPIETLLDGGRFQLPSDTWRPVSLQGTYLTNLGVLVRNRPNNGQPGFEQLIPFRIDGGVTVYVSRGWLPTGTNQDSPDSYPLPDAGKIEIVGRIMKSEPELARGAPKGQIASINPVLANQATGLAAVQNGYLRLETEAGKAPSGLKPMASPSVDEGNNLSYALQWILFAAMAIWALVWRIRRDRQLAQGFVAQKRRTQSRIDEAIEDEITKAK